MKEIGYYELDWRDDVAYELGSKSPFTGIVVNYYPETENKLKEKFMNKETILMENFYNNFFSN